MLLALLLVLGCSDPVDPKDGIDTGSHTEVDSGAVDTGREAQDTGSETDTAGQCDACPESDAMGEYVLDSGALIADPSRTRDNPLKGFMTSYLWGAPVTDFPDQMEFLYLPMSELWGPGGDTLEWGLEPYLVAAEGRGHHAVLRVFIDYPTRPSGLPEHLADTVSCSTYTDHGGGCSPDYDHPDLVAAMLGLIEALGSRYDGDPRLGFVQVGLLGFWGEWHTWPHTEWFPSEETQRAVLDAYDFAFETTQLQVRRAAVHSVDLRMGFHDDSFAYSTLGDVDWFFLPGLVSAGAAERWQSVAIGGELRPELQGEVFSEDYVLDTYSQDVVTCIEETHATYLLNYHAFNGAGVGYVGEQRARAEAAALGMGYQFEVVEASLSVTGLQAGVVQATVTAELTNSGVAPFYYPVFMTLQSEMLGEVLTSSEDLATLMPGERVAVGFELGRVPVALIDAPLQLGLTSSILQSTQRIALATHTEWTEDEAMTAVQWDLQCETAAGTLGLGDVAAVMDSGCDCVCDVDGTLRTCGGAPCAE